MGLDTKSPQAIVSGGPVVTRIRPQNVADAYAKLKDAQHTNASQALNYGLPFSETSLDLSTTAPLNIGNCWGLLYRREGSHPGGRLTVSMGGQLRDLYPGMRITGRYEQFTVTVNTARSALVGTAYLVAYNRPLTEADMVEPAAVAGELMTPVPLTSVFGTSIGSNTVPSGAAQGASFDTTGLKRVRVFIDCDAAVTGTPVQTFDLVPWLWDGTRWYEQGTERVSVPDVATAANADRRWRVISLPISGRQRMFLQPTNLVGTPTSLNFYVEGIE